MLTNKGKYGLKALLHLSGLPEGAVTQSAEIAKANQLSKKFLDTILGELRKAGLVDARKGKFGGYRLARSPSDISVGAAIRVLDGPLAPIACASRNAYRPCMDCPDVNSCAVRHVMLEVRDGIAEILENKSLAQLRQQSETAEPANASRTQS